MQSTFISVSSRRFKSDTSFSSAACLTCKSFASAAQSCTWEGEDTQPHGTTVSFRHHTFLLLHIFSSLPLDLAGRFKQQGDFPFGGGVIITHPEKKNILMECNDKQRRDTVSLLNNLRMQLVLSKGALLQQPMFWKRH